MSEALQTSHGASTAVETDSYRGALAELDKMNRELTEMKESMLKTTGILGGFGLPFPDETLYPGS